MFSLLKRIVARQPPTDEVSRLVPTPARGRGDNIADAKATSTIDVPTKHLLLTLTRKDDAAAPEHMRELSQLLRLQLRHELQEADSTSFLADAYELLSADAAHAPAGAAADGSTSGKGSTSALADRFVDGLCALMLRANYRLLSQREWEFAKSEDFMFTMPVDVAWESLDSALISRLFVRHPHLGLQAAQLSRRVLVFHRGSAVETRTALFLEEKLDMLIDKLFSEPAKACYMRALSHFLPQRARDSRASARRTSVVARGTAGEVSIDLRDAHRINLSRLLSSFCGLLRRFFVRLTLQEPTFEEVVVFYAEIGEVSEQPVLRLKSFRDIPVADIEVVFPGLRVARVKSADFVKIFLILLAGLATALYGFLFAEHGGWTVRATLIGLVGVRAFTTWRYVVTAKSTMDDFIRTTLYHRSQDSQKGVLLYVLHTIEQHEHREAILLYFLLLHREATGCAGVSGPEAFAMCQDHLRDEFGIYSRLNTEATLARLQRLGLVRADADGEMYMALPLEEGLAALRKRWERLREEADSSAHRSQSPSSSDGGDAKKGSHARALPTLERLTSAYDMAETSHRPRKNSGR